MPISFAGRRSATTAHAQMHACDLNSCTDLHCSRRVLALADASSCPATPSDNPLLGSAAITQLFCRAQIPIAPAVRPPDTSRGFPPWRVSDAGPKSRRSPPRPSSAGIRNPSQTEPPGFVAGAAEHASTADAGELSTVGRVPRRRLFPRNPALRQAAAISATG
jgi:hypothetical protein